jgi:hypothetical protein
VVGTMMWRVKIALLAMLTLAIHGACLCADALPGCTETAVAEGTGSACPERHDAHHDHDCCQTLACSTEAVFSTDSGLRGVTEVATLLATCPYYAASDANDSAHFVVDRRGGPPPSSIPIFISIRTLLI